MKKIVPIIYVIVLVHLAGINFVFAQSQEFIEDDSIVFNIDKAYFTRNHKRLRVEISVINNRKSDFFLLKPHTRYYCSNYYKLYLANFIDSTSMYQYDPCNGIENIPPEAILTKFYYKIPQMQSRKLKLSKKLRKFGYSKREQPNYSLSIVKLIVRNYDPVLMQRNIRFVRKYTIR
jgi:hypothetical protein